MRIVKLDEQSRANILADLLKRDPNNYSAYEGTVQEIVDDVRARGDEALFEYTKKFDGAELSADNIRVTQAEIQEALSQVDPNLLAVMKNRNFDGNYEFVTEIVERDSVRSLNRV